ncbi:hypothetical protein RI367_003142 [Sorochytrium milnesiophthora]
MHKTQPQLYRHHYQHQHQQQEQQQQQQQQAQQLPPRHPPRSASFPRLAHEPPPATVTPELPSPATVTTTAATIAISPQDKLLALRFNVVAELVDTERAYLADLCVLDEIYVAPAALLLSPADMRVLFVNMPALIGFSRDMLAALEAASGGMFDPLTHERILASPWDDVAAGQSARNQDNRKQLWDSSDPSWIGDAFQQLMLPMESVYLEYCTRNEASAAKLAELKEGPLKSELEAYLRSARQASEGRTASWSLESLLIKPVQRVLKYPLLLQQLVKATPEQHDDYPALQKVLSDMQKVADRINEFKRRKDIVERIVKKNKDTNLDPVYQSLREYLQMQIERAAALRDYVRLWLRSVQEYFAARISFASILAECYAVTFENQRSLRNIIELRKCMVSTSDDTLVELIGKIKTEFAPLYAKHIEMFEGPKSVIKKLDRKLLDYTRFCEYRARDEPVEKSLAIAAQEYEAIHAQLIEELPTFLNLNNSLFSAVHLKLAIIQHSLFVNLRHTMDELLDSCQLDLSPTLSESTFGTRLVDVEDGNSSASSTRTASSPIPFAGFKDIVAIYRAKVADVERKLQTMQVPRGFSENSSTPITPPRGGTLRPPSLTPNSSLKRHSMAVLPTFPSARPNRTTLERPVSYPSKTPDRRSSYSDSAYAAGGHSKANSNDSQGHDSALDTDLIDFTELLPGMDDSYNARRMSSPLPLRSDSETIATEQPAQAPANDYLTAANASTSSELDALTAFSDLTLDFTPLVDLQRSMHNERRLSAFGLPLSASPLDPLSPVNPSFPVTPLSATFPASASVWPSNTAENGDDDNLDYRSPFADVHAVKGHGSAAAQSSHDNEHHPENPFSDARATPEPYYTFSFMPSTAPAPPPALPHRHSTPAKRSPRPPPLLTSSATALSPINSPAIPSASPRFQPPLPPRPGPALSATSSKSSASPRIPQPLSAECETVTYTPSFTAVIIYPFQGRRADEHGFIPYGQSVTVRGVEYHQYALATASASSPSMSASSSSSSGRGTGAERGVSRYLVEWEGQEAWVDAVHCEPI